MPANGPRPMQMTALDIPAIEVDWKSLARPQIVDDGPQKAWVLATGSTQCYVAAIPGL